MAACPQTVARRNRVTLEGVRGRVRRAGGPGVARLKREDAAVQPPLVPVVVDDLASATAVEVEADGVIVRRPAGTSDRGGGGVPGAVGATAPAAAPRIVPATRPVSFNKEHDRLAAVVEDELGLGPYSGVAVVSRSRGHRDQSRAPWWDGPSLAPAHERLGQGCFV